MLEKLCDEAAQAAEQSVRPACSRAPVARHEKQMIFVWAKQRGVSAMLVRVCGQAIWRGFPYASFGGAAGSKAGNRGGYGAPIART